MWISMSHFDTPTVAEAERRKTARLVIRTFAAAAFVGLTFCVAGAVSSETLVGTTVQLHEGELVSSSASSLSNGPETIWVERSMLGGLAPGHSTGPSGLQLEGSVVAVPEPWSGVQGVTAMLVLGAMAWRASEPSVGRRAMDRGAVGF